MLCATSIAAEISRLCLPVAASSSVFWRFTYGLRGLPDLLYLRLAGSKLYEVLFASSPSSSGASPSSLSNTEGSPSFMVYAFDRNTGSPSIITTRALVLRPERRPAGCTPSASARTSGGISAAVSGSTPAAVAAATTSPCSAPSLALSFRDEAAFDAFEPLGRPGPGFLLAAAADAGCGDALRPRADDGAKSSTLSSTAAVLAPARANRGDARVARVSECEHATWMSSPTCGDGAP